MIFVHGVWMSSRFFGSQLPYFGQRYHALALDLRSHGQSSHIHTGHTVATYARDLQAFMQRLHLTNVVLVGWSMGAFVIWDYIQQFGLQDVKATVIVDEGPSDFRWPDYPYGNTDFAQLCEAMTAIQTQREALAPQFIQAMFKNPLPDSDMAWMLDDVLRLPASIAGAIFFDEIVQDYRPMLPQVTVPTLLCFGRDAQMVPLEAGEHLLEQLPHARLVVFEQSGHCPFWEEPERFNHEVEQFIQSLA